jgi:hypothetical protein
VSTVRPVSWKSTPHSTLLIEMNPSVSGISHAHFAADRSPGDQPERDVFSEVAMGERIRFRKRLPAIALNDSVDERPLGDSVGIGEELLEPCGIRVQSRGQRKPLLIESIDDLGDPGCDRSVITMS